MWKELVHFVRHAPRTIRDRRQLGRVLFFDELAQRLDAAGKRRWREALVADLEGEVLEIGAGTGLMFPHYRSGARVTAIEPDPEFLAHAKRRASELAAAIDVRAAAGERLPFADRSFDAVVVASVLCSVESVEQTLSELKRVLKPGGRLRLVEHYRSERLVPGLVMDLLNPIWLELNQQGCNMNREPLDAVRSAGFAIESVDRFQIFAPGVLTAFPYESIRAARPPVACSVSAPSEVPAG